MNVLMLSRVLPGHGPGGLGAAAADLAGALARAGARVRLLTTAGGGDLADAPDVEVTCLASPPGRYSPAWWRESVRACEGVDGWPDAVLSVSAAGNAAARRPRGRRPVFVFQAHGTSAGEFASKLRNGRPRAVASAVRPLCWGLVGDRAYRDYDAVAAVGEAVRRQLLDWPTRGLLGATPIHLVANGVAPERFRFDAVARARFRAAAGVAADAPLVLSAGRLQADKGPLLAAEAFARALAARPALRLAAAGEGPETRRLARRLAAPDLAGAAVWLGGLDRAELAGWFSAADALLFPTRRSEGLPLVVLEALAAGLAVLTTPFGAADRALPVLRLPPNDPRPFAEALVALQPSAERESRLPPAFTLASAAAGYLALFERLLRGASLPAAA